MGIIDQDSILFNNVKTGAMFSGGTITVDATTTGVDLEWGGIINAVDIDWNGAQLGDKEINTTGELLSH